APAARGVRCRTGTAAAGVRPNGLVTLPISTFMTFLPEYGRQSTRNTAHELASLLRSGGSGFTGAVSSLVDNAGHPGQTHRSEHWRKLLSLIESDVRRWAGGGCGDRRVRPGRGR